MRKLESITDESRGMVTYELDDGRRITCTKYEIQTHGLEEMLRRFRVEIPTARIPVFQSGVKVGTVPATFEPLEQKSNDVMYLARLDDFIRSEEGWLASPTMGPGDFDAIPGFSRL